MEYATKCRVTKKNSESIEEILRLVKKDQEDSAARQRQWDAEKK